MKRFEKKDTKKILFVCTGNTCRSPMAEYIAKKHFEGKNLEISSAGIMAYDGEKISSQAQAVLKANFIDASHHKARRITQEIFDENDTIIAMTSGHKIALVRAFAGGEKECGKVVTFDEICSSGEISDPYGEDLGKYLQIFECINKNITKLTAYFEI